MLCFLFGEIIHDNFNSLNQIICTYSSLCRWCPVPTMVQSYSIAVESCWIQMFPGQNSHPSRRADELVVMMRHDPKYKCRCSCSQQGLSWSYHMQHVLSSKNRGSKSRAKNRFPQEVSFIQYHHNIHSEDEQQWSRLVSIMTVCKYTFIIICLISVVFFPHLSGKGC